MLVDLTTSTIFLACAFLIPIYFQLHQKDSSSNNLLLLHGARNLSRTHGASELCSPGLWHLERRLPGPLLPNSLPNSLALTQFGRTQGAGRIRDDSFPTGSGADHAEGGAVCRPRRAVHASLAVLLNRIAGIGAGTHASASPVRPAVIPRRAVRGATYLAPGDFRAAAAAGRAVRPGSWTVDAAGRAVHGAGWEVHGNSRAVRPAGRTAHKPARTAQPSM